MTKQLNLLNSGNIIPTPIHGEMQRSYLEYAMSVIVGRALPDVRDGLKPVHRRIIYAMHELGLTPDRPYRKCARVVGDVLGKYHPHGDQSVYDALVRLVQDFSTRYPLLGGHGNFGSVDNDPPAAMRYTETRLAPIAHEALLPDIGEATVEFSSNFDNSQQEPVVLPAQLPILLLNGCTGIAVGMATNIPPHNLGEVVDGLIALIDRPDLTDEQLWQLIPAPDFPTGGEITGTAGIRDAYSTGKGSIPLQGITSLETIEGTKGKRRREAIIVTELPYQVNKAGWIEKVAELVNAGKIEGISDLRDESDREGMRVVIELKRDTDPEKVLQDLRRQTALAVNFGVIMLTLVEGLPRQLTLRQILNEFLSFREETLRRQYRYELEQTERRIHLVEGLLSALEYLDEVVEILRHSPDGTTAKATLESQLGLSDRQSEAILAMPMRRLTGMEIQNLRQEFQELSDRITRLQKLLDQRPELLKALKKDLRSLKKKFADPRRTRLPQNLSAVSSPNSSPRNNLPPDNSTPDNLPPNNPNNSNNPNNPNNLKLGGLATVATTASIVATTAMIASPPTQEAPGDSSSPSLPSNKPPKASRRGTAGDKLPLRAELTSNQYSPSSVPEDVEIELTHNFHIQRQKSGVKMSPLPTSPLTPKAGVVISTRSTNTQATLILITASGKAYGVKVQDIPPAAGTQGKPLASLLPKSAQAKVEEVVSHFLLPEDQTPDQLILLTQQGSIKRLPMQDLQDLTMRGLTLLKLKEGDRLQYVTVVKTLGQNSGQSSGQNLPKSPGQSQNNLQSNLQSNLVIATSNGRLLRWEVSDRQLPILGRSAQGQIVTPLRLQEKFVGLVSLTSQEQIILVTQSGYGKRLPINILRMVAKGELGTQGVQFSSKQDKLVGITTAKTPVILSTSVGRIMSITPEQVTLAGKDGAGDRLLNLLDQETITALIST